MKWFAWRLVELGTLGFAVLGFCCVPLGGHTAYERVVAVVTSPEVRHLSDAMDDLRGELLDAWGEFAATLTALHEAVRDTMADEEYEE